MPDFFSGVKKRSVEPKRNTKPNVKNHDDENVQTEDVEQNKGKITMDIPLSDLVETAENEYIFGIKDIDVDRLADDIKENGFTGSIDVVDLHNGKYQIFVGHTRYRAVKKLGWETIPCTIAKDMSDEELYQKLIGSNVLGRKLTPLGYARAIQAYKEKVLSRSKKSGSKRTNIAKFFGIAEGQVPRFEAINSMPSEIQEMCDGPDFPYSVLVKAVSFTDEQKYELLKSIKEYQANYPDSGLSVNIIEAFINKIKLADEKGQESADIAPEVPAINDADTDSGEALMDDVDELSTDDSVLVDEDDIDEPAFDNEEPDAFEPVMNNVVIQLERAASSDFKKVNKEEAKELIKRCEDMIRKIKKMI